MGAFRWFSVVGLQLCSPDVTHHFPFELQEGEEMLLGVELIVERVENRFVLVKWLVWLLFLIVENDGGVVSDI